MLFIQSADVYQASSVDRSTILGAREYNNSKVDTAPTFGECPVQGGDIEQSYKCVYEYNCDLYYEEKGSGTMTDYSLGSDLGWDWLVILENFCEKLILK